MGYPTSVFSPSARSNGQTIDASHVQDIQVEITALENGLLGTITHNLSVTGASTLGILQAGASTVTSLVVSNGSTLGTLQAGASTVASLVVSGGSTLGTLQAAASTFSVRPVTPPPEMALVFLDSTAAIASSAASTLAFKSQAILTNSSMHSTGTNPERITPQSTGVYKMVGQIAFGLASAISIRQVIIEDSSGGAIGKHGEKSTESGQFQVVGYKRFDALGGYVTLKFATDAASTHSLSSGIDNSWFSMVKL